MFRKNKKIEEDGEITWEAVKKEIEEERYNYFFSTKKDGPVSEEGEELLREVCERYAREKSSI